MFSDACPYYSECVSSVKYEKENSSGGFRILSFVEVANVLRDDRIDRGRLNPSAGNPSRNFNAACGVVASTRNPTVVAGAIFRNVPEVKSWEDALALGEEAEKGYRLCQDALSNYTKIDLP